MNTRLTDRSEKAYTHSEQHTLYYLRLFVHLSAKFGALLCLSAYLHQHVFCCAAMYSVFAIFNMQR